jgi:hypothetical protein
MSSQSRATESAAIQDFRLASRPCAVSVPFVTYSLAAAKIRDVPRAVQVEVFGSRSDCGRGIQPTRAYTLAQPHWVDTSIDIDPILSCIRFGPCAGMGKALCSFPSPMHRIWINRIRLSASEELLSFTIGKEHLQ